tara:strand:+ start:2197 stop:3147 length:951 start_codon:yes stop_codon:yes gene_type:complete
MTIGIELDSSITEDCNLLCDLIFDYNNNGSYKVSNMNDIVKIIYEGNNSITFKESMYDLKQITLCYPSYHKIDNIKYDVEMILIHEHRQMKDLVFLSVLFEVTDDINKNNDDFFREISINIPNKESKEKVSLDLPSNFTLKQLLPEITSFYNYKEEFDSSDTNEKTKHHYIIFNNIVPIYYEYYINVKKLLNYREREYLIDEDIILYYNRTTTDRQVVYMKDDAKLHFVKCRKVRKHSALTEEIVTVESDLPMESFIRNVLSVVSFIWLIFLALLIVKLINRKCLVDKLLDKLSSMWGKVKKNGSKGINNIKKNRK